MTAIDPTAINQLKFAIDIEGSNSKPICKLSIPINESMSLSFNATIEDKVAKIEIPPIYNLIEKDCKELKDVKFEVYIDEMYETPWQGTLNVIRQKPEINLTLESTESKKVKKNLGIKVESVKG